MSAWNAFRDGGGRVGRAPAIVVGVWVINLLAAIPLTLMLHEAIAAHLGSSLRAEQVARGFDVDWYEEFEARADALGRSFGPSVIGFAAPLSNISAIADGNLPSGPIAIAVAGWLLLWTFLSGGIIDRYARNRATRAAGFFGACGDWFGRMLRLDVVAGLAWLILFAWIHPLLFDRLYGWLTHNQSVERAAFVWRVLLYLVFALLACAIRIFVDVSRVRAIVEDRRSIIGAYLAGWRFLRQRPLQVIGIYACIAAAFAVLLLIYALIAPGAQTQGGWVWIALLIGQLYIIARLWLKLQTQASLVALYQTDFGHRFVAAQAPTTLLWPDAPDAEPAPPAPSAGPAPDATPTR
jgi:hypothetical protein